MLVLLVPSGPLIFSDVVDLEIAEKMDMFPFSFLLPFDSYVVGLSKMLDIGGCACIFGSFSSLIPEYDECDDVDLEMVEKIEVFSVFSVL